MRKIRFWYDCAFSGCEGEEIHDVKDVTTDCELEQRAREIMENNLQPMYGWEEVDEEE